MQAVAALAVRTSLVWLLTVMAGAMRRVDTGLVVFPTRAGAGAVVVVAVVLALAVMAVRALSSSDTRWPHNG
jgi:hypothetical protein